MADDGPHAGFQIQYTAGAARRLFRMLLCAEVILAAAYIFAHIIAPGLRLGPIRNFLNVDREVSIPTWFSATQLFFLAAVLWSWCYHFLNGIRHLCWDAGFGFERSVARLSGWAVAVASIGLAIARSSTMAKP